MQNKHIEFIVNIIIKQNTNMIYSGPLPAIFMAPMFLCLVKAHLSSMCYCVRDKVVKKKIPFYCIGLFPSPYGFSFTPFCALMMFSVEVKEKWFGKKITLTFIPQPFCVMSECLLRNRSVGTEVLREMSVKCSLYT